MMLALTAFTLLVLAQDPEPSRDSVVHKTPQAVFDAAMVAQNKKDFKAMVACLAPEARKDMASGFAWAALNIKEGNPGEIRKALKPMFDVLDKHGLTQKATKNIQLGDDPKVEAKSRLALRKMIKNHAAFAAEYLAAQDKVGGGDRPGETKTKLTELKIKGDKATATMEVDFGGNQPTRQPIEFVKIGGGWKMIPEPREQKAGKDK
jgi:hypothetical protein